MIYRCKLHYTIHCSKLLQYLRARCSACVMVRLVRRTESHIRAPPWEWLTCGYVHTPVVCCSYFRQQWGPAFLESTSAGRYSKYVGTSSSKGFRGVPLRAAAGVLLRNSKVNFLNRVSYEIMPDVGTFCYCGFGMTSSAWTLLWSTSQIFSIGTKTVHQLSYYSNSSYLARYLLGKISLGSS